MLVNRKKVRKKHKSTQPHIDWKCTFTVIEMSFPQFSFQRSNKTKNDDNDNDDDDEEIMTKERRQRGRKGKYRISYLSFCQIISLKSYYLLGGGKMVEK